MENPKSNNMTLAKLAKVYGYNSFANLTADKFSHSDGLFPSLTLRRYEKGKIQDPPDKNADYKSRLSYYTRLMSVKRTDDAGQWKTYRKVPYMAWNSWTDREHATKLEEVLQKAYGWKTPYFVINYETGAHTEICYGKINDMRRQLIEWYRHWEKDDARVKEGKGKEKKLHYSSYQ